MHKIFILLKWMMILLLKVFSNFSIAEFKPSKPIGSIVKKAIDNSDLVFVNTPGGPLGASSIYHAEKKGKKIISYAHTLDWELFPFATDKPKLKSILIPILKRIYSKSDLIVKVKEPQPEEIKKIPQKEIQLDNNFPKKLKMEKF